MTLVAGTRLGVYEVIAPLGTGGMGEVYRARDTRLKRDVALKILPASLASDPERLARFQREAEVLASLDHPHIGAIYGLEEGNGTTALVLQLVEGDTLADRIVRGRLPLDEALPIARQIAEALEAAHEQGVIHRDLKPANVKITPDGVVKVLDFGLAKLIEPGAGIRPSTIARGVPSKVEGRDWGSEIPLQSQSPTITTPALMTGVGTLLGTAAYMSPEQVKGRPADKRSDVWAFGCVFYEMLTGRRAFDGEDVADTFAAVLRGEPDWSALPRGLPSSLLALLGRCVQRDRRQRIGDVAAVLFVLREPSIGSSISGSSSLATVVARPRWRTAASYLAVAASVCAVTSAAWWNLRPRQSGPVVTRFSMVVPQKQPFLSSYQSIAISPDGTRMAYVANFRLHIRAMDEREGRPIPGLEDTPVSHPVFSPDGKSIVFYGGDRTLKRIAVDSGGSVVTLGRIEGDLAGLSWGSTGIVFGQGGNGIMRISPSGGAPERIATVGKNEVAFGPQLLPGEQSLLFTIATGYDIDRWDQARIVVQSLASGERKTLIEGGSDARYLASGHIVYAVGGVVYARRFDPQRLEVSAEAVPVIDGVRRAGSTRALSGGGVGLATTQFSVSASGTLVYVPGPSTPSSLLLGRLVRADRSGKREALNLPPGPYQLPRVSPDGTRLAFGTEDGKSARIFVYDLSGKGNPRPLTFEGHSRFPIWSADGEWIVFQSDHEGDIAIFRRRADGTSGVSERLTKPNPGEVHAPEAWQPKGDTLLFTVTKEQVVSLRMLSMAKKVAMPFPGLEQLRNWPNAVFSPDGRWIAYATGQSMPYTSVFVEPFPPTGIKGQLATSALSSHFPVWSSDGKELVFVTGEPSGVGLAATSVTTKRGVEFGMPVPLQRGFRVVAAGIGRARTFDIMPDGQHFIGVVEPEEFDNAGAGTQELQVVINWFEELKRLVPQ
jgi:serine/threonine protein kinase/Tol biopolymer transport system component